MKDPQSMKEFDEWRCAFAAQIPIGIENAQRTNQLCAVMEDTRNNLVESLDEVARVTSSRMKLIN